MGQCGLGHTQSPVLKPTKTVQLTGVPVYQVKQ